MTDQVLDILKLVLLALLYLFFARVLWAVWSEVRRPANPAAAHRISSDDATAVAARPAGDDQRRKRPARGHSGRVGRLVVIEPKARKGTAFALSGELTIGRDPACAIVIDDDTFISTLHARVFDHEGQPMVEDLGSTNGSYLNGNKLMGARLLHPGDRLQVGYTVLEAQ